MQCSPNAILWSIGLVVVIGAAGAAVGKLLAIIKRPAVHEPRSQPSAVGVAAWILLALVALTIMVTELWSLNLFRPG